MAKSKKNGLNLRRKGALERLEVSYEKFKENKKDKEEPFRKYADECARMHKEIEILKKRIK